jgi:hypothetical protein
MMAGHSAIIPAVRLWGRWRRQGTPQAPR